MAQSVVGNGPISYRSTDGRQLSIPLSGLSYSGGTVTVLPLYAPAAGDADGVSALLADFVATGEIGPAPLPASVPAIVFGATQPGAAGNAITVRIDAPQDVATNPAATFDVTVTESHTYPSVTVTSVAALLGSDASTGTVPKLVHVKGAVAGTPKDPDPGTSPFVDGADTDPVTLDVKSGADKQFTLEADRPGKQGGALTATIGPATPPAPHTFSLTTQWLRKITGVTVGSLPGSLDNVKYIATVTKPQSGNYGVPPAGTTTVALGGGANAQGAVPATATVSAP